MIGLYSEMNKQIKSFIDTVSKPYLLESLYKSNLTSPSVSKARIEFMTYGFTGTGININEERITDNSFDIINQMYFNFKLKIRIVSNPEETLAIADKITMGLNSFYLTNSIMKDIEILNERIEFSNLDIKDNNNTYYVYDITIPCVCCEEYIVDVNTVTGYFDHLGPVDIDIK